MHNTIAPALPESPTNLGRKKIICLHDGYGHILSGNNFSMTAMEFSHVDQMGQWNALRIYIAYNFIAIQSVY